MTFLFDLLGVCCCLGCRSSLSDNKCTTPHPPVNRLEKSESSVNCVKLPSSDGRCPNKTNGVTRAYPMHFFVIMDVYDGRMVESSHMTSRNNAFEKLVAANQGRERENTNKHAINETQPMQPSGPCNNKSTVPQPYANTTNEQNTPRHDYTPQRMTTITQSQPQFKSLSTTHQSIDYCSAESASIE